MSPSIEPEPPHALAELRALQAAPGLGCRWQAVGALLNRMAAADNGIIELAKAGRLLQRTGAERILAEAAATSSPIGQPEPVGITVTGTGTLNDLAPALTAEFARHGLLADLTMTDFASYRQSLLEPPVPAQLTLCVLDSSAVTDRLPSPWRIEDIEAALAAVATELTELVAGYLRQASGVLVLNTLPLAPEISRQLIDRRSRTRLEIAWRALDTAILQLALEHDRVVTLDLNPLVAAGGAVADPRMSLYAKMNLGPELLGRYAREVTQVARAMRGRTKKMLVLDLDGTLWDGILAEDGAVGIAPAGTLRGEAFQRFQRTVLQLGAQGVLLAVSSKNDGDEVLSVLADHPDMTLRPADFTVIEASWEPKPTSLERIADSTGLDPSSFVFIDDSAAECGSVAALLPQVAVIRLDDEPALHVQRLLADGWFDVGELTSDDLERAAHYRRQPARSQLRSTAASMADYLRELGVTVRLAPVREHEITRVAQLTQRTNQFNLTTERLQPADVEERLADSCSLVLGIHSADRFGSDGLVGAVFARRCGDELVVDNLILSCRVFERGIEQATMSCLLSYSKQLEVTAVRGRYRPSAKNGRVAGLYPSLGFMPCGDDGKTWFFLHDLAVITSPPQHIDVHFEPEGLLCG